MNRAELRQAVERVHREFSAIHEKYPERDYSLEINRYVELGLLLQAYRAEGAATFLDVGCGSGHLPLLGSLLGLTCEGVDYQLFKTCTPCDLDVHRKIWARYGVSVGFGDVIGGALDFEDGSFDIVSCCAAIGHFHGSPKHALLGMKRVLRTGGRLIIEVPNHARLINRVQLLLGRSVHDHFDGFFESGVPFFGHFREYTLPEVKAMGPKLGMDLVFDKTFNVEVVRDPNRARRFRDRELVERMFYHVFRSVAFVRPAFRDTILCVFRKR